MSSVQPAFKTWTAKLNQELARYPGNTDVAREALDALQESAEKWQPSCAGEVQKTMRADLWKLRESIIAPGQPEASPELKQAYEKLRNLSLNDTVKAALGPIPSKHYVINAADIPNFRVVDPNYLRGGQFNQAGMEALLNGGCRSEVDLRGDDRDNQWDPPQWNGLKTFKIDIPDFGVPTFQQADEFVRIVDDPANWPVFVHCKAGVGRTEEMTNCREVAHGATAEEVLSRGSFNAYHASPEQRQFVRDYETYLKNKE